MGDGDPLAARTAELLAAARWMGTRWGGAPSPGVPGYRAGQLLARNGTGTMR